MRMVRYIPIDPATPQPKQFDTTPARRPREDIVIIDHRTYRIKAGHTQTHLAIYEKYGFAAQTRHLGQPFAYLFAETGDVNTVVHQWAYEDAADRAKRRAAMAADPEWQVYVKEMLDSNLLIEQKTSIMLPAKFAPIKR
jgi:NIPSNAP protein